MLSLVVSSRGHIHFYLPLDTVSALSGGRNNKSDLEPRHSFRLLQNGTVASHQLPDRYGRIFGKEIMTRVAPKVATTNSNSPKEPLTSQSATPRLLRRPKNVKLAKRRQRRPQMEAHWRRSGLGRGLLVRSVAHSRRTLVKGDVTQKSARHDCSTTSRIAFSFFARAQENSRSGCWREKRCDPDASVASGGSL